MTANAEACGRCLMRGLRCTDQESGLSKAEMVRRMKKMRMKQVELQDLISEVLQKLHPNGGHTQGSKVETAAVNALKQLQAELPQPCQIPKTATPPSGDSVWEPLGGFDNVPLLGIFKNDTLREERCEEGVITESLFDSEEQRAVEKWNSLAELKAAVPNTRDLRLLFESGQAVWQIWQRSFPGINEADAGPDGGYHIPSLQSHISNVVESNDPVAISKVLLCSALSAQQIDLGSDITESHLSVSPKELQERTLNPVEKFLREDEKSACSLEGLQCILTQTRIYINEGMPHKAWLTFRRAISYAQLLGLHRQQMGSEDGKSRQKLSLWMRIWQGERYLSLVLGLPSSAVENLGDVHVLQKEGSKVPSGEYLLLKLGAVSGRMINRDQHPTKSDYATTIQIDQDLEECKNSMPETWWETPIGPDLSLASAADMLAAKFAYQFLRILLHLPFMLQSKTNRRYEFSRIAALDASREMIEYYQIMRDVDRPLFNICCLADFQAFTAAMVLTLNLLDQAAPSNTSLASHQTHGDWEIIVGITQVLKRVSKSSTSSVATQAAKVLEDLYHIWFNNSDHGNEAYHAVIPYFGKLTINVRSAVQAPELEQMQVEDQDVLTDMSNAATNSNYHPDNQNISFESYLPLSEFEPPWQNMENQWMGSTTDFSLCDDWGTFLCNDELFPLDES
ncbi:hypothetical protein V496_10108 [Pseudogymnoascus sp. VKM F-4515 (FW-2607)]|nr:hypothetical protein V496_10108 [Pseudogymnoascus sp. VKM F-4515 (FW-2607)]